VKEFPNYELNPKFKAVGLPKQNPKFMERSLATYKLDQLLGAGVIPPTFAMELNNRKGTLMEGVQGKSWDYLKHLGPEATPAERELYAGLLYSPATQRSLGILRLLDFICGQVDRHRGNVFLTKDPATGTVLVRGIDNDLAFGKNFDMTKQYRTESEAPLTRSGGTWTVDFKVDQQFAQKIIDTSKTPEVITEALAGLLDSKEIDATIVRLKKLAFILGIWIRDKKTVAKWD
jgi:hypothetical protein